MADVHYLTADGLVKLKAEFEQLKGPAREDLAKRLRFAIQQGDLSENADYIQAKEEQGFLEGRIQELTEILSNYQIIDERVGNRDKVEIGAHITIQEDEYDPETYHLVGPKRSQPGQQPHLTRISDRARHAWQASRRHGERRNAQRIDHLQDYRHRIARFL